jgi:hypothetical protein
MSFSQRLQQTFIPEYCMASRSYSTCQNAFRDTLPDSPVPEKSTTSRLPNRFRDTGTLHRVASNMTQRVNARIVERWHFQHLTQHFPLFTYFNVNCCLRNRTCVRNGLWDFSIMHNLCSWTEQSFDQPDWILVRHNQPEAQNAESGRTEHNCLASTVPAYSHLVTNGGAEKIRERF